MLGRRSFPFGDGLIFRGELLVSGRVSFIYPNLGVGLCCLKKSQNLSTCCLLLTGSEEAWLPELADVGRGGEVSDGKGFPICFFCAPKTSLPEYMIRILMWYISYIYIYNIHIYTWIHEAFSMWTYWWSVTFRVLRPPSPRYHTRWAPSRSLQMELWYPYKWQYKWVTGVTNPVYSYGPLLITDRRPILTRFTRWSLGCLLHPGCLSLS